MSKYSASGGDLIQGLTALGLEQVLAANGIDEKKLLQFAAEQPKSITQPLPIG